jgi:nicotinate-nucleotide adenylyltransferase
VKKAKKIGLFFGSFNPIHIGHLAIANYFAEFTDLNEVWFVISPHNPLKNKSSLLAQHHRLYMVNLAIEEYPKFKSSDIEFHLPQPSYTIHTLAHLREKYPQHQFCLILGQDNLTTFHKWKNYDLILQSYFLYIYPRPNVPATQFDNHPKVIFTNAPQIEISASFIRQSIKEKKDVRYFLHPKVWQYIDEMNFYKR